MGTCESHSLLPIGARVSRRKVADDLDNRKCRTLTAYASLTTVGDQSWYEVEEGETVHGAKLIQRNYVG